MATYVKKTWETINLPPVSGDTYFRILDHSVQTDPSNETTGVIYDGLVLDGYWITDINEILGQYVNPDPILFDTSVYLDNASHSTFYIYYTQDDWTSWTYDTVILTYDWSYENSSRAVLSDPVINLVDDRQFFLYTIKAGTPDTQTTVTMKIENITVFTQQISGYTYYNFVTDLSTQTYPGEFTYAYSYDFFVDRSFPIEGIVKITIGPSTYYVTHTCYRYCLYYLNQYGGWDSLLFRGRELKTDDLSRLSYKKRYVANSTDFHKVDYLTKISERWELNTSFLDDTESSKMINLMASNRIYIHDLETGQISPVNINNSSCEHKTYKNQGRKMATYTIDVSASQNKYRI